MNDPKGYSANISHLERSYSNIDPVEYGRFKYTYDKFDEYVISKLDEYLKNEDSE